MCYFQRNFFFIFKKFFFVLKKKIFFFHAKKNFLKMKKKFLIYFHIVTLKNISNIILFNNKNI